MEEEEEEEGGAEGGFEECLSLFCVVGKPCN